MGLVSFLASFQAGYSKGLEESTPIPTPHTSQRSTRGGLALAQLPLEEVVLLGSRTVLGYHVLWLWSPVRTVSALDLCTVSEIHQICLHSTGVWNSGSHTCAASAYRPWTPALRLSSTTDHHNPLPRGAEPPPHPAFNSSSPFVTPAPLAPSPAWEPRLGLLPGGRASGPGFYSPWVTLWFS